MSSAKGAKDDEDLKVKQKSQFKRRGVSSGKVRKKRLNRSSFVSAEDGAVAGTGTGLGKAISGDGGDDVTNRIREQYSVSERDDEQINDATSSRKDTLTTEQEQLDESDSTTAAAQVVVVSKKASNYFGPVRAPSHLRNSIRMDYQPDVCKDYKETGYCGFGDSCKFLHDRSDYKAGWQLDSQWNDQQQQSNLNKFYSKSDDSTSKKKEKQSQNHDADGLPFACFICRSDFKNPVVTLCNHYFCEQCAIDHMTTKHTCPICGKQMRNTLNVAHKLIEKLENHRAKLI